MKITVVYTPWVDWVGKETAATLRELGYEVTERAHPVHDDPDFNIILCPLPTWTGTYPANYVLWHFEQDAWPHWDRITGPIAGAVQNWVWDRSIMNRFREKVMLVEVPYPVGLRNKCFQSPPLMRGDEPKYCFVGTITPRRRELIDKWKSETGNTVSVINSVFGDDLVELLIGGEFTHMITCGAYEGSAREMVREGIADALEIRIVDLDNRNSGVFDLKFYFTLSAALVAAGVMLPEEFTKHTMPYEPERRVVISVPEHEARRMNAKGMMGEGFRILRGPRPADRITGGVREIRGWYGSNVAINAAIRQYFQHPDFDVWPNAGHCIVAEDDYDYKTSAHGDLSHICNALESSSRVFDVVQACCAEYPDDLQVLEVVRIGHTTVARVNAGVSMVCNAYGPGFVEKVLDKWNPDERGFYQCIDRVMEREAKAGNLAVWVTVPFIGSCIQSESTIFYNCDNRFYANKFAEAQEKLQRAVVIWSRNNQVQAL